MRIVESAATRLQPFVQRTEASSARQGSDVSREERMQLLSKRLPSPISGTERNTYSERAQLLSVSGTPQQSWVA
jgi:hypothetical protein